MATVTQIRGMLLEEIALHLLLTSGYRRIVPGEEGTRSGPAGVELKGRGCWHQVDAFVAPSALLPFMYPIRLILEAKCYEHSPVGLNVARGVAGLLLDVNQNYFTRRIASEDVHMTRFNYHGALFSTSGYTRQAQAYATAHQIFLIDYQGVPIIQPVIQSLFLLDADDFVNVRRLQISRLRMRFREFLAGREPDMLEGLLTDAGMQKVRDHLTPALDRIRGSYFGMVEGKYPIHLLSASRLPLGALAQDMEVPCAIRVSDDGEVWAFEPSGIPHNSDMFFRLEFQLPDVIADILHERSIESHAEQEWAQLVAVKRQYLRFVDVTGIVGTQVRTFRLTLDQDWLGRYVTEREARR